MNEWDIDSGPPWWQFAIIFAAWFFGTIALVRLIEPIGLPLWLFCLIVVIGQMWGPLVAFVLMLATGLIKELPR
jgi:hypothetical protein